MTPHLHSEFVEGCYRCDLSLDEVRCEFARYEEDGPVIFECDRTDTEPVTVGSDEVLLCPKHRGWAAAMGAQTGGTQ